MIRYYSRQGRPINFGTLIALMADDDYRRVALEEFDGQRVSTIWLGINYNFGTCPLAIFETMIFGGEHNTECRRYPSEGAALQGHREAVNNLRRGMTPWVNSGMPRYIEQFAPSTSLPPMGKWRISKDATTGRWALQPPAFYLDSREEAHAIVDVVQLNYLGDLLQQTLDEMARP